MIKLKGVTKGYFGKNVLEDIHLEIKQGSMLGLIGPGGAGKSILLKLISGLIKPDEGEIFIGDQEITGLSEIELSKVRFNMGMLFQNYALFDFMNVGDNIAFPLVQRGDKNQSEIRTQVKELLHEVGLPGIEHQYPNELSGGMKKRVTFARAVITDAPILLYDDPTAGLDPVTSSKIFILLKERQKTGTTTAITVSHDVDGMKSICDEWALLNQGKLLVHGNKEAITNSKIKLVRQFWRGESDG